SASTASPRPSSTWPRPSITRRFSSGLSTLFGARGGSCHPAEGAVRYAPPPSMREGAGVRVPRSFPEPLDFRTPPPHPLPPSRARVLSPHFPALLSPLPGQRGAVAPLRYCLQSRQPATSARAPRHHSGLVVDESPTAVDQDRGTADPARSIFHLAARGK